MMVADVLKTRLTTNGNVIVKEEYMNMFGLGPFESLQEAQIAVERKYKNLKLQV